MGIINHLRILGLAGFIPVATVAADWRGAGPLYDDFSLTLASGHRKEILGPLFYLEQRESQLTWAIPPLTLAHTADPATESEEWDFAYPLLTYDRFGSQYHWQILQLWNVGGGENQGNTSDHRFSLFPFYFQQRSPIPSHNYTALVPLYGHLDHRFFRDEIDFTLFPLYSKTRKGDVVTRNMPYPFFHRRQGNGLEGWQLFPLVGHEHKIPTTRTNGFGDVSIVGGHDYKFVLWPFFHTTEAETGTTNATHLQALTFVYSLERSAQRESTSYGWPLGVTHTIDREKQYEEWGAPWPLVVFAHGPGKTTDRVWPFFSQAHTTNLTSDWYLWPVYKFNGFQGENYTRGRTRILFFLYSDVAEEDTAKHRKRQRVDFFPFYTRVREFDGSEHLHGLSILEPIFPNNKSLERDVSPLYTVWRSETNAKTGARSQSLLWNLYRRDTTPQSTRSSALFGLFQYQKNATNTRWRVFFIPFASPAPRPAAGN